MQILELQIRAALFSKLNPQPLHPKTRNLAGAVKTSRAVVGTRYVSNPVLMKAPTLALYRVGQRDAKGHESFEFRLCLSLRLERASRRKKLPSTTVELFQASGFRALTKFPDPYPLHPQSR